MKILITTALLFSSLSIFSAEETEPADQVQSSSCVAVGDPACSVSCQEPFQAYCSDGLIGSPGHPGTPGTCSCS